MESAEWIQQLLIITLTIVIEDQDDAGKSWHRLSFHDKNLKAWVCRSVALIFPFLLHYNGGLSKAFWCYLYKAKSNKMYSKLELTHPYYYCFFKTLESHILKKTQNFSYLLHSCYETSMTLKAQYLNIPVEELGRHHHQFSSVQFSHSVMSLWDPMNRSTPGLPVHHQLPEFTQTHAYRVGDAIQPSHPLSSPSPPALNPSQHQGLFQWVNSSHEVAKVLESQLQHQSFQWTPRTHLL